MEEKNLNTEDTFLAKWLAGEITDEAFKKYVSDKDFIVYQKLKHGVNVYGQLEAPLDTTLDKINSRISEHKKEVKKPKYNWVIAVAASAIILFGLFNFLKNDVTNIHTDFGQQKTFALLDGSEVILNSKSEISYDTSKWKTNRTLFLKGEAYFKVRKGSVFTINTDNGSVTVLGTEFNVNSKGDYFQVVCYEGKVRVKNNDSEYILTPKQQVRKINGNVTENWESNAREPSWIRGESSFKDVPIKYVISALSAQYNIQFKKGDIDESALFTGSFTYSNLNKALKTVFKTMRITYNEKEKGEIELSRD